MKPNMAAVTACCFVKADVMYISIKETIPFKSFLEYCVDIYQSI